MVPDFEPVFRDVDEDVPLAEIGRQPAPALEVQRDLLDALRDRHVQLRDRRRADGAVRLEAVPALEPFHRLLQFRAVGRILLAGSPRVVAGDGQPAREQRNGGVLLSRFQLQLRGHGRPAAALLDVPVLAERLAQPVRMAGRQSVE